jgi:hypothetical protein
MTFTLIYTNFPPIRKLILTNHPNAGLPHPPPPLLFLQTTRELILGILRQNEPRRGLLLWRWWNIWWQSDWHVAVQWRHACRRYQRDKWKRGHSGPEISGTFLSKYLFWTQEKNSSRGAWWVLMPPLICRINEQVRVCLSWCKQWVETAQWTVYEKGTRLRQWYLTWGMRRHVSGT